MKVDPFDADPHKLMRPSTFIPPISIPMRAPEVRVAEKWEHTSEAVFEHLVEEVKKFEQTLEKEYEVGVLLASFGQQVTLQVTNISYISPLLIVFVGVLQNGDSGKLIQNISQLNFLLTKLPRQNLEKPRRPIGFGNGGQE